MKCNQVARHEKIQNAPWFTVVPDISRVCELTTKDEAETLQFLAIRPVHTVVMTSFIQDNGMESPLNRGTFYGYRNSAGTLEAVALIGHATLVEARSHEALKALAFKARKSPTPIHLIMSSGNNADTFWSYFTGSQAEPRLTCTELLFEVGFPLPVQKCEYDLRLARPEELEEIAKAQAEVAEIECGINPLQKDRDGFLKRVARRIEQGRVFVVFEGEKLVFKADVIAETDKTAYLEGVYTGHGFRGRGIGPKCLSRVCLELLRRVENVCLLSNVEFTNAHMSFLKAGMRQTDSCTTLFV